MSERRRSSNFWFKPLLLLLAVTLLCCVSSVPVGKHSINENPNQKVSSMKGKIHLSTGDGYGTSAVSSKESVMTETQAKNNESTRTLSKFEEHVNEKHSNHLRGGTERELHAQDGFQRLMNTPINQWTGEEWVFFFVCMFILFCCILPICRRVSCTDLIAIWCCYEICCVPGGVDVCV